MNSLHTLTTKRIALLVLVVFIIGFAVGFVSGRRSNQCLELPVLSIERDTVTVRDTVNGKIQKPKTERVIKVDTARINLKPVGDGKFKIDTTGQDKRPDSATAPRVTPGGDIAIPISSKVYQTDQYRAVVSGWRSSLDTIELYRDTRTITETVTKLLPPKRKTWAVAVGPSATYTTNGAFIPGASVVLGFVIKSW